jgi:hypothetical protein
MWYHVGIQCFFPESSEASRSQVSIEASIVEKEKRQTTMTLFFYHEVKVVLISYLHPGTFVKKKNAHIGIK